MCTRRRPCTCCCWHIRGRFCRTLGAIIRVDAESKDHRKMIKVHGVLRPRLGHEVKAVNIIRDLDYLESLHSVSSTFWRLEAAKATIMRTGLEAGVLVCLWKVFGGIFNKPRYRFLAGCVVEFSNPRSPIENTRKVVVVFPSTLSIQTLRLSCFSDQALERSVVGDGDDSS